MADITISDDVPHFALIDPMIERGINRGENVIDNSLIVGIRSHRASQATPATTVVGIVTGCKHGTTACLISAVGVVTGIIPCNTACPTFARGIVTAF
jgi:hypothetical protein